MKAEMQKPSWFKPENNLNVLLTVAGFSVAIVIGGACMEAQANGPAMQIAELEMEDARVRPRIREAGEKVNARFELLTRDMSAARLRASERLRDAVVGRAGHRSASAPPLSL